MSPLAVAAALALAPLVVIAIWNLLATPRLDRWLPAAGGPCVSVLVPARDEADNLRTLIPALLESRYAQLEVVVLDDGSRDGTLAVARGLAARDARVRAVEGQDLPPGWTGKNWACHQLSRTARGEILLFCDADVRPGPDAVGRTVAALEETGAGALTALPRDEPAGGVGRGVIPLVTKVPIAALLPTPLARSSAAPALSAGNGQWFAWRRDAYERVGGHAVVRGDALEDVRLARRAKAAGVSLLLVVAARDLAVRMYGSAEAIREGFSKNLYPLLGGHGAWIVSALVLFVLTMGLPLLLPILPGARAGDQVPLAMLIVVRLAAAALVREPPSSVALHPVAVPLVAGLVLESWRRHRSGSVRWKRRVLQRPEPA
jgi:cellulose synthase/poly-beta-1,6-N-acetylglucosamine synthase-like glycosyltransferase